MSVTLAGCDPRCCCLRYLMPKSEPAAAETKGNKQSKSPSSQGKKLKLMPLELEWTRAGFKQSRSEQAYVLRDKDGHPLVISAEPLPKTLATDNPCTQEAFFGRQAAFLLKQGC